MNGSEEVYNETQESIMVGLQQVLLLKSDPISVPNYIEGDDYLEQLASTVEDAILLNEVDFLVDKLGKITEEKENEIQELCNENQKDYARAVHQLSKVKAQSDRMRMSVIQINDSLQKSGTSLVAKNKLLSDIRMGKGTIEEVTATLKQCLKVLNMTNRIYEMVEQKKYFPALKGIDDLQKNYIQEISEFEFARLIRDSVPLMRNTIRDDVIADLQIWLASVRTLSVQIGKVAFAMTEAKRIRWKERVEKNPNLRFYKLNSAVEVALQNDEEYDPLNNNKVHIELTPLYEAMHICSTLGFLDAFQQRYQLDRFAEQEYLLPKSFTFTDDNIQPLENLLHSACGFAIFERETARRAHRFRTPESVNELWESVCQKIANLIDPVLPTLYNPETMLRVRNLLGLFIQTVEGYEYSVVRLNSFVLSLFKKYSQFLKERFAAEFEQTVTEDDYMPMVVNSREIWEQVISVAWYKTNVDPSKVKIPYVFPFSQVYPLSCAEIRNFVNQHYSFADEYSEQNPERIELTLRSSLDELLVDVVCNTLVGRLKSNNREEIVQIIINLEYFETASIELESMLNETSTAHFSDPLKLRAAEEFSIAHKKAEKRIFELVNSKIDDFLEIADYNWETETESNGPSSYLIDMVNFLETLVNSTLVNLPKSIKSFIYFEAFDHLATSLLDILLNSGRRISRSALANFNRDVSYLEDFVAALGSPNGRQRGLNGNSTGSVRSRYGNEEDSDNSLLTTFTELRQTIDLLMSSNIEEYNNTEIRMRKYGRVKPQSAIALVEK
ncbi:exocyst complex subunit Sec15-like-domain-containing protein [Dipodascopsis uninucleata]